MRARFLWLSILAIRIWEQDGAGTKILRGSIYTTVVELGPRNHNKDGLLGPDSIIVVCMDPMGL